MADDKAQEQQQHQQQSPQGQAPYGAPLHRSRQCRMVAGVAGGIAEHFGVDPTLVRVGIAVLTVAGGIGVPLYLAAWALIPEEGHDHSIADELVEDLLGHRAHA
jgi:phage shock protein PspC (stress-responsive transcriptional regulator)